MLITAFLSVVFIKFSPAFSDSYIIDTNRSSDDYVPCKTGWYYFRDKCYRGEIGKEVFNWTGAVYKCREYGADLVSIESQEEQNFIIAFLLLESNYNAWIGLSYHENESNWRWSDGSVFNYTNWSLGKPNELEDVQEDCVHMYVVPVGKWNDSPCDYTSDLICKMKKTPANRSPNLMYCSSVEGGGLKYENSCYHIVTEMKSWQDAETYCKNKYKGHLLSIIDKKEDLFLELALPDIKKKFWIGIKIQAATENHLQQKWTSGWYLSFDKFNKEEKYVEGTCVAQEITKEWITIPCSRQLPFICKVSKAIPPVLKSPPIGSYCPKQLNDWIDLGGKNCYYIKTTETYANFAEARTHCEGRGGDLVSIHSEEEAAILQPFIKDVADSIYIGLIRVKDNTENIFGWTDGSMYDYNNWDHQEPNKTENECVTVFPLTMKWRDTSCGSKEYGYICSVKKIMPSTNGVDETVGCSSHMHLKIFIGVSLCIHAVMCLLGVVV